MATDPNNIPNSQLFHHQPGLFNTNSYISSGIPYLTGSVLLASEFGNLNSQLKVSFPYVTRTVTIVSRSTADLRVHFNSIADGNVIGGRHYLSLTENRDSITFNVKCKEIYISLASGAENGDFELVAELTNIKTREMFALTGSGLTE